MMDSPGRAREVFGEHTWSRILADVEEASRKTRWSGETEERVATTLTALQFAVISGLADGGDIDAVMQRYLHNDYFQRQVNQTVAMAMQVVEAAISGAQYQ